MFRVLKAFPSILVWSDSLFCQIAWIWPHTISILHWIYCIEEHGLSSSFESFPLESVHLWLLSSINWRSRRGKCTRYRTLSWDVGQVAFSPECPWFARRYKKWLKDFKFKQYWNVFLGLPPFARISIQSLSGDCETPSNFFFLHSSMMCSVNFSMDCLIMS